MMTKLMKYDLKSMLRIFIPLWLLAPIISLLLSFSIRASIANSENSAFYRLYGHGSDILLVTMSLLFVGVLVALMVLSIVLIIQRFWNGLLKDEGYLMFTLPVEPWQLITSKGLTATFVSCISGLIAILSCIILFLASSDEMILGFLEGWDSFWKMINAEIGAYFYIIVLLCIILAVLSTAKSIYQIYSAMAVGQLVNSHRVFAACAAYVGISVVISVISSIIMVIISMVADSYEWLYRVMYDFFEAGVQAVIGYLLFLIFITVIQLVIFHVITERILATRLNLE